MNGTQDLIDKVVLQVLRMASTDAENAARRVRVRQFAQEIVDEFCHENFRWMRRTNTAVAITLGALGQNTLPSDFMELGPEGYIKQDGFDEALIERPYQEIIEAQAIGVKASILTRYALGSISAVSPICLLTDPPDADTTCVVNYKMTPPNLTDANPGGLTQIPSQYHFTVVYTGVKWKLYEDAGDNRADQVHAEYREAKGDAIKVERRNKTAVTQLPRNSAGRGMY